jgi:hypothetical protein
MLNMEQMEGCRRLQWSRGGPADQWLQIPITLTRKQDPDPHRSQKSDPYPDPLQSDRIRIKVMRIRNTSVLDPEKNIPDPDEFEVKC